MGKRRRDAEALRGENPPREAPRGPSALDLAQERLDGMRYESPYAGRIDALAEEILSRGPFSYDPSRDPAQRALRERYAEAGRGAMEEAMGQAAALSGGYGNSYAATAGAGAYRAAMGGLDQAANDLYDRAYAAYERAGAGMRENLALLQGREDAAYRRYRDRYADAEAERDAAYRRERDEQEQRNWEAQFDFSTRRAGRWRRRHPEYF